MDAAAGPLPTPFGLVRVEDARLPLGTLLLRDGALTADQLEVALAEKEHTGRRLGEIVTSHGWVTHAQLAMLLAEQHGLEFLDLAKIQIAPGAAMLLPEKFARRYEALPVRFLENEIVLVAVSDPTNVIASDDLRLAIG